MTRRLRVGVLFGGRSGEHEVSLASARAVIAAMDPDRYEVVPIGITRSGAWLLGGELSLLEGSEVSPEAPDTLELVADVTRTGLVPVRHGQLASEASAVDVIFPVLHGPNGEDGTVQGLLELAGVPYVGSGVMASAVGMDKAIMKALFQHAGLPVVPYRQFTVRSWQDDPDAVIADIEASLEYPLFVKPCNLGSSVGITCARMQDDLRESLRTAALYDRKILVEQGVTAREIECGLLGNDRPAVSTFGEVVPHHAFYDYEAKYTEGLTDFIIPAQLSSDLRRSLTAMAITAFQAIDAIGMARVDFFIEADSNRVLVNEINTMPGLTPTSMFPKLWEASGLPYPQLVDKVLALALERQVEKRRPKLG